MKILAKIVLIIFITFLSGPTIVSLIKESDDSLCCYDSSEEEQGADEIQAVIDNHIDCQFLKFKIVIENNMPVASLFFYKNIPSVIIIPPPDIF